MSAIAKKSGLLSILLLGTGNIVGVLISAFALILYSRYMGPAEFGIFSVAFAFMQIMIRVVDYGTNMAAERSIARVYDEGSHASSALIRTTLWLKVVSFILLATPAWILAPWITHDLLHIESVALIRAAIALSAGTVIFEYATLVFQATHRFMLVARMTIAQGIGKLIFSLLLIWQGMLTASLGLLIYGIMPAIGVLLAVSKRSLHSLALPKTWKRDVYGILSVAKWTSIAALALTIADNLDILMVQALMSSYDAGIWSGAVRIATFANLLGWSIGSVLNVRVARYRQQEHLRAYLGKAWKLSLAVFALVLISIPFAEVAITLSIGPSYAIALEPLKILLISIALFAATAPFAALFYVFDSAEYYAITGFAQTILLVVGDYILIPLYGLTGSAWVRVGVRLLLFLFTLYYARRAYKHQFATSS